MKHRQYESTENKDRVRKEDKELIEKEFKKKKAKLSYLGMPSGELKDILEWRDYLDRCTAVENNFVQRHELALNVVRFNLNGKIDILFGDIDDILIKGKDKYDNKLIFPYDIIFLDYFGGILYRGLRRVNAIASLISKQRGNSFLLFLTFNLKESRYAKNTIVDTLRKIKQELSVFCWDEKTKKQIVEITKWYEDAEEIYRQKIFVPYFIKTNAENVGFEVYAYPPVFYEGFRKNPMLHFAFKLVPEGKFPTKAVSKQTIIDIINLDLKGVSRGMVSVLKKRSPNLKI
ncbi:hypothetical protein KJA15_01300 [Patescibacteria group bacterium]|nr:hypothetical protein [Patescibacteria group bacterium]